MPFYIRTEGLKKNHALKSYYRGASAILDTRVFIFQTSRCLCWSRNNSRMLWLVYLIISYFLYFQPAQTWTALNAQGIKAETLHEMLDPNAWKCRDPRTVRTRSVITSNIALFMFAGWAPGTRTSCLQKTYRTLFSRHDWKRTAMFVTGCAVTRRSWAP
jgi:hypothetical protein